MKVQNIGIQRYRSLHDVFWAPGDLNVVIGPNGSGKSNLLRAFELLSISAQGKLTDQILREGGMGAMIWDGRTKDIGFNLTLASISDQDRAWLGDWMNYDLSLARLGVSTSYAIKEGLVYLPSADAVNTTRLALRDQTEAKVFEKKDVVTYLPIDQLKNETLISAFTSPISQPEKIRIFREQLASWHIYHQFSTSFDAPVRQAPVTHYAETVVQDGRNLIQVLHTLYTGTRDFKHDLDLAMRAAFGDEFDELTFPPAADQRIQMRLRWKSLQREQSAADLSDGALRFLYLIAILANPTPPALIAIDEPETGLHPTMLPIIAEFAVQAASQTQVIFTTHSAEFLNSFKGSPPTTTVAEWKDGKTSLQIVSAEALQYWLKEYTLGSLYLSGELEQMV